MMHMLLVLIMIPARMWVVLSSISIVKCSMIVVMSTILELIIIIAQGGKVVWVGKWVIMRILFKATRVLVICIARI